MKKTDDTAEPGERQQTVGGVGAADPQKRRIARSVVAMERVEYGCTEDRSGSRRSNEHDCVELAARADADRRPVIETRFHKGMLDHRRFGEDAALQRGGREIPPGMPGSSSIARWEP